MDRYLLDTNVVIRLVFGYYDELSADVRGVLYDHGNRLYMSVVSAMELVQLYRLGKIDGGKKKKYKRSEDLIHDVESSFSITALRFDREHIKSLSELVTVPNHNDPFDHAIIAHAITEKLTLVSSDLKFESYAALNPNLKFVLNKR